MDVRDLEREWRDALVEKDPRMVAANADYASCLRSAGFEYKYERDGEIVIPAGSKVHLMITAIHESERKSDKTGKLVLTPTKVVIAGKSYPLSGSAIALDRTLKDRKTNAGDLAKVGMGAGAGALLGTAVTGGSTKGAVIGGVAGAAVGTQRAIETQDRDVVVPAGSRLKVTLAAPFRRGV